LGYISFVGHRRNPASLNLIVRRQRILRAFASRVHLALRGLGPWAVVIVNVSVALVFLWALVRQHGISTAGSDGLMPTPWETGYAPYIIGLLTSVLVSAILTALRYRFGSRALMGVTTIYTLCLSYWMVAFLLSMREAQIQWTAGIVLSDALCFFMVIAWFVFSYWSLFMASTPNNRFERSRATSPVDQGGSL
jgi:hypothetical protein